MLFSPHKDINSPLHHQESPHPADGSQIHRGDWHLHPPRGGISIYPYANYGRLGTKYEEMATYRMMNHGMK